MKTWNWIVVVGMLQFGACVTDAGPDTQAVELTAAQADAAAAAVAGAASGEPASELASLPPELSWLPEMIEDDRVAEIERRRLQSVLPGVEHEFGDIIVDDPARCDMYGDCILCHGYFDFGHCRLFYYEWYCYDSDRGYHEYVECEYYI